MDRREVVNSPKEYDAPSEWAPSGPSASASAPDGAASRGAATLRFRYGGMRGASGRPGARLNLPVPDVGVMPQATRAQLPSKPKSAGFRGAPSASRPLCLYLGPAGERCYQPALDNGFCPAHQPNASPSALRDQSRSRKKKAAATVGIIAAFWPIIEEVLRQLFRLMP